MKKTILISILLTTIVFSSCSLFKNTTKKIEKKLIGKWEFVNIKSPDMTVEQQRELESYIKEALKGSYLRIDADKTFVMKMKDENQDGEWKVSEDGKELTLADELTFVIDELTEDVLTITTKNDKKKLTMYLERAE